MSGAFHTALMKPAVPILKAALEKVDVHHPRIPIYSNVDGKTMTQSGHIRKNLPKQVICPVKWEQSMVRMFDGYEQREDLMPSVYECGPGSGSLLGMLKAVNGKAGRKSKYIQV